MSLITEAQLAVMIPTNKEVGEWCAAQRGAQGGQGLLVTQVCPLA